MAEEDLRHLRRCRGMVGFMLRLRVWPQQLRWWLVWFSVLQLICLVAWFLSMLCGWCVLATMLLFAPSLPYPFDGHRGCVCCLTSRHCGEDFLNAVAVSFGATQIIVFVPPLRHEPRVWWWLGRCRLRSRCANLLLSVLAGQTKR